MPPPRTAVAERFWAKVQKNGPLPKNPSLGPCWLWTGGQSEGYGIMSTEAGKNRRAHQISWDIHDLGPIPDGQVIRHRCDERRCVNPAHLMLGTRADNNRDTHERGRWTYVAPDLGRTMSRTPQRRGPKPGPIEPRFWAKVDKHGPVPGHDPTLGPCWLWTSTIDVRGYGTFFMPGGSRNAPKAKAHRVSVEITSGPIPDGLDVLHHCDVRRCVNPTHLYLGTDRENQRDAFARGRHPSRAGTANPNAKLSDEQVAEIRRRYASGGVTQATLAAEFGVAQAHISVLVRRGQRV